MKPNKWEKIGVIGVDAGLCWIGDPYYLTGDNNPPAPFADWTTFCSSLDAIFNKNKFKQFNYQSGYPGLGVLISTGYGDGEYNVYGRFENGKIMGVMVNFDDSFDKSNMEEPI